MRIFITGATGFLGKHVVRKLSSDRHKLLLLSRQPNVKKLGFISLPQNIKFLKGDLGQISKWRNEVKKFKPDVLVHLGWEDLQDRGIEASVRNFTYGLNLFRSAAEIGCRHIIGMGSQWEYEKKKGMAREDDPLSPFNPLAAAKSSLCLFGISIALTCNLKFSWLRQFPPYGPGQRPDALIPLITRYLKAGQVPELNALDAKNDFIYAGDIAEVIAAIIKRQKNQIGIYNVGSGKLTSVRHIVREVYNAFGRKMDEGLKSHGQSHVPGLAADISKIRREIGWKPRTSLGDGVRKTVDYFRDLY